jgi:hypothetical protein
MEINLKNGICENYYNQLDDIKGRKCVKIRKIIYCLPTFLIIGVMKCGTGALMKYLNLHPKIISGISANKKREVKFFGTELYDKSNCPIKDYLLNFPTKSENEKYVTFDKSPDYIRKRYALGQIQKILPNIKLIILIRNPVERAYSEFRHHCRHKRYMEVLTDIVLFISTTLVEMSHYVRMNSSSDFQPYRIPNYYIHAINHLERYQNKSHGNYLYFPKGSIVKNNILDKPYYYAMNLNNGQSSNIKLEKVELTEWKNYFFTIQSCTRQVFTKFYFGSNTEVLQSPKPFIQNWLAYEEYTHGLYAYQFGDVLDL